jgi:hypothetical protein
MKMKNLLMTIFSILGLATISFGQTVPSYIPSNGLVGWWPFNGNANDESGNGNNGTVNGTILTTDRFGIVNKAFYFNGSTDIITVPNSGTISLGGTNQLSVQAWAKKSGNQSTMHILGKRINGCGSIEYQFGYCELGCQLANIEGIGFGGMPGSYVLSGAAIDTVNWHHFVGTFNGQTWKLYLNSILIDSVNNSTTNPNVGDLIFGSSGTCPNWQGSIDDIGIWNRALDSCEVKDLYFASLGNCCNVSVTTQPINQSVNISNNAQFTTASSDSLSTYQWQTDLGVGFQNLNSVGQYSGTANDTLTIANTTLSNNNQPFRCIISSGACTDTSNVAILSVNNNVGINEFTQNNLFSVYPNPAKSQINVKADAKLLGSIYTIYDNTGKLVLTGKINSENTVIDLGNLSGGIYLFSVGENLKQTFKVIKE